MAVTSAMVILLSPVTSPLSAAETETAQNGTAAQMRIKANITDMDFFNITSPPETVKIFHNHIITYKS